MKSAYRRCILASLAITLRMTKRECIMAAAGLAFQQLGCGGAAHCLRATARARSQNRSPNSPVLNVCRALSMALRGGALSASPPAAVWAAM